MKTSKKIENKFSTTDLDGYQINYLDVGEGDPVVFVHGGVSDYRVWAAQMEPFSAKYRVIVINRRYAYPNDQTPYDSNDHSVKTHAQDLQQLLQKLNLGPVHLVGHSFGGFISLMTSLGSPGLIRSLTLLEPPIGSLLANVPEAAELGDDFANNVMIPAAKAFDEENDKKAVAIFIGGVMADSMYYDKASENEREMWLANTPDVKAIAGGADIFPLVECNDLNQLKVPTLLIKGEHSPKDLRLISDELHKCLPNNQLQELPAASHGLQHQNPEGFNKMVLKFIDKH